MKNPLKLALVAALAVILALVLVIAALLERQTEPPRPSDIPTTEATYPTQSTENLTPWG